jgi:hypothetical protein
MKTTMYVIALALSLTSCNAQEKNKDTSPLRAKNEIDKKEAYQPKGSWSVTKETDEKGNIIRYDSIYTYSYGTRNGDTLAIKNVDSVIKSFQKYFREKVPNGWNYGIMNPYWEDSLLFDDFFSDNYFQDRWKFDYYDMESQFRRMDSLRESYIKDFYPEFFEKRKEHK